MIRKKRVIYLTITSIMDSQVIKKSTAFSEEFINYEKMFFQKKARVFNNHKKNDHAIDIENIDSSYGPLYNLSIPKLQILKKYLNNVLSKK